MTRTLFPYEADQHVIREFLFGRDAKSDWLKSSLAAGGARVLQYGGDTVAFLDAQGALQVNAAHIHSFTPIVRRIQNHLLDLVQHEHRMEHTTGEHGLDPITTFDGVELTGGVPMTILGPLGMQAWREANR